MTKTGTFSVIGIIKESGRSLHQLSRYVPVFNQHCYENFETKCISLFWAFPSYAIINLGIPLILS